MSLTVFFHVLPEYGLSSRRERIGGRQCLSYRASSVLTQVLAVSVWVLSLSSKILQANASGGREMVANRNVSFFFSIIASIGQRVNKEQYKDTEGVSRGWSRGSFYAHALGLASQFW